MAVRDPQTIDTIARSGDGALLLALTEDRPYTAETAAALAEDLRVKLNTYIYAVKSGQVHERRAGEPLTVVLYTISPPPAEVLQILDVAGQVLAEDGVTVDWRLLEAAQRTYQDVLREMVQDLVQAVPSTWVTLTYSATLVGSRRRDTLVATTSEGPLQLPGAPEHVRSAVEELKRLMWTPERGAWLGVELFVDRNSGQLTPGFNYDLEPAGEPLPADVLAEELRHYPRPPGSLPGWWAQRVGG
jgi:hypothetical protein